MPSLENSAFSCQHQNENPSYALADDHTLSATHFCFCSCAKVRFPVTPKKCVLESSVWRTGPNWQFSLYIFPKITFLFLIHPVPVFVPIVSVFGVFGEQYRKKSTFMFMLASWVDVKCWTILTKVFSPCSLLRCPVCQKCLARLHPRLTTPLPVTAVDGETAQLYPVALKAGVCQWVIWERIHFHDKMEQIWATHSLHPSSSFLRPPKWVGTL